MIKMLLKLEITVIIPVNICEHNACNLHYKTPKSIPAVFHNGSNYDFHLIIKQLAKDFKGPFSCIKGIYYYIIIVIIILLFILLLLKGIYPYEYMRSWKNFNEPVPLDKKYYYSEFNDANISDSDLEHVKKICEAFNIINLVDYHDLYVSLDVALLADVFENFRDTTINIDKLDPAYYLSAPGLSWQSCLKKTRVTLELLTDKDMLLLIEKGIRSGMCNAVCKYVKANNKYM